MGSELSITSLHSASHWIRSFDSLWVLGLNSFVLRLVRFFWAASWGKNRQKTSHKWFWKFRKNSPIGLNSCFALASGGRLVILALTAGYLYIIMGLTGESYNFHWFEKLLNTSSDEFLTKAFIHIGLFFFMHVPELKHLGNLLKNHWKELLKVLKNRHPPSWISTCDSLHPWEVWKILIKLVMHYATWFAIFRELLTLLWQLFISH